MNDNNFIPVINNDILGCLRSLQTYEENEAILSTIDELTRYVINTNNEIWKAEKRIKILQMLQSIRLYFAVFALRNDDENWI